MERTDEDTFVPGGTARGYATLMSSDISNSDDIIDSRAVITRIAELEDERNDLAEAVSHAMNLAAEIEADEGQDAVAKASHEGAFQEAEKALAQWDEDYGAELRTLKDLEAEAEGYSDWRYGAQLIRDSYFKTFARELAEDVGAIKSDLSWPYTCIDWERAAEELQQDYASVEFAGVTYYIR